MIFVAILLLIAGFVALVKGADVFVDGAAALAGKFGIPQLVIGLTIVAMGTSLPEAAVSITAGIKGNAGITVGNIVGSNILNILIILGVTALITNVAIQKTTFKYEIPYMLLITAVLLVMGMTGNEITFIEGVILWILFIAYLLYLYILAKKGNDSGDEQSVKLYPVWKCLLFIVLGGVCVVIGSQFVVNGATTIARACGMSERFIGLTIVAFGTSAPELTVSVSSALKGSADIAIGNVVGSNIFNTLMIVGCTALFAPIAVTRNTLQKEIPLCILSSIALLICANDIFLNGDEANILSITDGLLLLCFFAIFMSYTFAIASHTPEEAAGDEESIKQLPLWKSILYILGGLGALIAGGSLFVDGASGIARNLGVSESVIGLTLVAGGTSLPELATSIVAALKKNPEIAIGNVVGSNLFNVFFVLGCSASITPLHLTGITNLDLWVLIGSGILLWMFGLFFAKRTITRIEGSIMVLCYIAYTTFLIYSL